MEHHIFCKFVPKKIGELTINKDGYESKTIAYSIYHVFRIEDIVLNTLIKNKEQVFLRDDYQNKMNLSIITTGNELMRENILSFLKH